MNLPETRIFPSVEALVTSLAKELDALLRDHVSHHPNRRFHLALSGGRTPRALFQYLAEQGRDWPWSQVCLWQVDERCVPPDHADSNARLIREHLLAPLGLPLSQLFRMRGELPAPDAAAEYLQLLREEMGEVPFFDLVLLGMGEDGHTASLFPHEISQIDAPGYVRVASHPSGQSRITLGLGVLRLAKSIWWMVTGVDKAERVAELFAGARPELPAAKVLAAKPDSIWWLDQAAGEKIPV